MAKAPKKYAHVLDGLPKLDAVEPERRAIVDAVKAEIKRPLAEGETPGNAQRALQLLAMIGTAAEEARLHLARARAGAGGATSYASAYALCRAFREQYAALDASMGLLIEAYQWLMVEEMEREGIASVTLASGQHISTWEEPKAVVEDREAFRLWCLNDPVLARKMAIPWQTTNELAKAMLLNGQATIDPETGEVTPLAMPAGLAIGRWTKVRLG